MNGPGVIDQFLQVFSRYIDSGFGLVRGDVGSLARILVALDVSLAALFWLMGSPGAAMARFIRKILYVGAFAFLISNFQALAQDVYASFARLGIEAGGSTLAASDLLHPGHIAGAGIAAVRPLLSAAGQLAGFPAIFENFVQIAVLLACVLVVLAAFFILAIQLFVVIIEFKLTTLAGFVLVPFGLFGRTAFLAERVLGNVMASGVKVLVLAVIVGVGSTLFQGFVPDLGTSQPTLDEVLAIALGALSLLGLGIFGPAIAAGLVSGAPHLGAGSAAVTALGVGGAAMAGTAVVRSAASAAGAAIRGGASAVTSLVGRRGNSGSTPNSGPNPGSGSGPSSGPQGPGGGRPQDSGPSGGAGGPSASPGGASPSTAAGETSAESAGASPEGDGAASSGASDQAPAWARRMRRGPSFTSGMTTAANALRAGDHAAGWAAVPLDQEKP